MSNANMAQFDYGQLDQTYLAKSKDYPHRQTVAIENGYQTVSEMIIKSYYNDHFSIADINTRFRQTNKTVSWLYYFFNRTNLLRRPIGIPSEIAIPIETFKELDRKYHFQFYREKLSIANGLGFKTVTEAVVHMYFDKHFNYERIGNIFKTSKVWTMILLNKIVLFDSSIAITHITPGIRKEIIDEFGVDEKWLSIRAHIIDLDFNISPRIIREMISEIGFETES